MQMVTKNNPYPKKSMVNVHVCLPKATLPLEKVERKRNRVWGSLASAQLVLLGFALAFSVG